jgi:phosphoribosylaminoimidazole-succinocarboxamide synthase
MSVEGDANHLSIIQSNLRFILNRTALGIGKKYTGKVRDVYETADKVILITTDRMSAFDRLLACVPFKGQVLNLTSVWWFNHTKHIVPNHLLAVPHPNVIVAKKCPAFRIEFVVRAYLTGTTSTSIWMHYKNGSRNYCGHAIPENMVKNQKLPHIICTPTTKDDLHDRPISAAEIVSEGWMTKEHWEYTEQIALKLFKFGQEMAIRNGLILVDTKYEFGLDSNGEVTLIDEIHTPDSSRYWIAESYESRMAQNLEPENIDKEFLRIWFRDNCDPYNDVTLPEAPAHLISELSRRYIMLYEKITGEKFVFPKELHTGTPLAHTIHDSVSKMFVPSKRRVCILRSRSDGDEKSCSSLISLLSEHKEENQQLAIEEYFVDIASNPLALITLLKEISAESNEKISKSYFLPSVIVVSATDHVDEISRLAKVQTNLKVIVLVSLDFPVFADACAKASVESKVIVATSPGEVLLQI